MSRAQWAGCIGLDQADRGRSLLRCVRELFGNALEACSSLPRDEHQIRVQIREVQPCLYYLCMEDDGCGFGEAVWDLQNAVSLESGVGFKAVLLWNVVVNLPEEQQGLSIRTTSALSSDADHLCLRLVSNEFKVAVELDRNPKPPNSPYGGSRVSAFLPGPGTAEASTLLVDFFQSLSGLCLEARLRLMCTLPDGAQIELLVEPTSRLMLLDSSHGALLVARLALGDACAW
jgi:hypothetical protein